MANADEILTRFTDCAPWNRMDEWSGIYFDLSPESDQHSEDTLCAFFGEDSDSDYKLLILRGVDATRRYLQYRSGEWIPEFGLDFATTDAIKVSIQDEQVVSYESMKPGRPPEPLRLDEKQLMFDALDGICHVISELDADRVPALGETEDYCYALWKVAGSWRVDVREFPDEVLVRYDAIEMSEDRLKRIRAAKLPQEGVWETSPFFLPATRFQGDQEVFIQCAGVAERASGLLGLVTLEAHADPDQEVAEALVGSIEKQKRIPEFLVAKEERVVERLLPLTHALGIQVRLRKRLKDLEHIREEMIEQFPDDDEEETQSE